MDKPKFTVESTPPAAFTEAENAPARINTRLWILQISYNKCDDEAHNGGKGIAEHAAMRVVDDTHCNEQYKEHHNGNQRERIAFFHTETYFLFYFFHLL